MPYRVKRYHDFSAGHRVYGHESKCAHLHGHNYRAHFVCEAARDARSELPAPELDKIGRVIDFGEIKARLCEWLEREWDHKFLVWARDPLMHQLVALDRGGIAVVPFNPTAENMARYLVEVVGPRELDGTGIVLRSCQLDETRKCSAEYVRRENG